MTTTTRPWLDASIPADRRARLLLDAMTREEKVAQMVQISYSIVTPQEADEWARLGAGSFLHILGDDARRIQRLATESRLGVPVIFGIDAIHGQLLQFDLRNGELRKKYDSIKYNLQKAENTLYDLTLNPRGSKEASDD